MIQFNTLLEAVHYQPTCLLCQGSMVFEQNKSMMKVRREFDRYHFDRYHSDSVRTYLTIDCSDDAYIDEITICLETMKIDRNFGERVDDTIYNDNSVSVIYSYHSYNPHPFCGKQYVSISLQCRDCQNYCYMIQIAIDLEKLEIISQVLNSETITFAADDGWYEIKNVYTFDKTEYSHYNDNVTAAAMPFEKNQDFPLIPIDRQHPDKTLQRIKNLLLFI